MKLLLLLIFIFPLTTYSYTIDEELKEAIHLSSKNDSDNEAVDDNKILKSILEAIVKYQDHLPIERISFYDISYPRNPKEFQELNGKSLILITSLTHNKEEFPLKKVFIQERNGSIHKLQLLAEINKEIDEKIIEFSFGKYRSDSLYILPLNLTKKNALLKIDFNKNRKDFTLIDFPLGDKKLENEVDFNKVYLSPPSSKAILELMQREIPFIIEEIKKRG